MPSILEKSPHSKSFPRESRSEYTALVPPIAEAANRRVAVVAVHHVRADGRIYTGGAEKYVQTVVRALLDAGAAVHVGYSGTSIYESLLDSNDPRRLTVERTGWLDESLAGDSTLNWSIVRERRRWLRATRVDTLFVVQQDAGAAFFATLVAARSLGLRVVSSIRQSPPVESRVMRASSVLRSASLLQFLQRPIRRRLLPALCCHALIYNSERVRRAYEENYRFPKARAHVIYNGERFSPREAINEGVMPARIASIGRVSKAKGSDVLLDAFRIVSRRHPEARLTYYGDGELIPGLSAEARRNPDMDGRVSFAGYVESRREIFGMIDICVQPSRRESMSNSVVEAQARGIPCVVSDVGGMREVVEHDRSGYVVPSDDAAACADAICKLLSNRERYTRFGRAAAIRARRRFDLGRLMTRTVRVILGQK